MRNNLGRFSISWSTAKKYDSDTATLDMPKTTYSFSADGCTPGIYLIYFLECLDVDMKMPACLTSHGGSLFCEKNPPLTLLLVTLTIYVVFDLYL